MPPPPTELLMLLGRLSRTLESLDIAVCVFDEEDRTLLWNSAFLRMFPEHDGQVHAGEAYRLNLQRFYRSRLGVDELAHIERYIEEGIQRHRQQTQPFLFEHRGVRIKVASVALEGVGRIRIWKSIERSNETPVVADGVLATAGKPVASMVLGQLADSVMLTAPDGRITWVNAAFATMYGQTHLSTAIGRRFEEFYRAAWAGASEDEMVQFRYGNDALRENLRFVGAPFEIPLPFGRWTRVTMQPGPDGGMVFTHVDISILKRQHTEIKAAEQRARSSNSLLEAALELMQQGVMMVNAERVVEICNKRAIDLLGLPESMMASKPTFDAVLAYQWANDEFRHASQSLQDFVRAGGIKDEPQIYDRMRPDGRVIEVQSVPIEGGGVLRTYTDITARRRDEDRLRHISRHDGLTALLNREVFLEYVAGAVMHSDADGSKFAVHYIDLDRFKPVNDRLGHAVGDKVLALVSERLRSLSRERDVVARMGGDEFAILQRNVQTDASAIGLAKRISAELSQPMVVDGVPVRIGASVGFALYPGTASDVESLLRQADAAMYTAKAEAHRVA